MEKVGGLIVAAGNCGKSEEITPLMKLGDISVIRRLVLTFQQANVKPIVVVTGYMALEVEHHLTGYDVIFIRNEDFENTDKFYSAKMGLEYLKDKCENVVFTPVTIPMYTSETIKKMISLQKDIVIPLYHGRKGHPLLINSRVIDSILQYRGLHGMSEAINQTQIPCERVEVEDLGVLFNAEKVDEIDPLFEIDKITKIHPWMKLYLEKEDVLFDSRARLLLTLLEETHSVKGACKYMALSTGKAWKIINALEASLGYSVVERQQGGKKGGKTHLTEEGKKFLQKYILFENEVRHFTYEKFLEIFDEYK